MVQPVKDKFKKYDNKKHPQIKDKKPHPKFGTSKLEKYFEEEFLKKIGVDYIWQYEAKDIGRFFDFRIKNGPILEINGSYWHGDKRIYEEKNLNATQKKNMYIDKLKQIWAENNGIQVYYFWEKDIYENPEKTMASLQEIVKKYQIKKRKNQRH